MTTNTKTLEAGTLAYDLAQHEPVVIIDPDVGTIEEQEDVLEEVIRGNIANQACGIDPDTQCLEVMFCNLDGANDSTYTYPETRIGVPRMDVLDNELSVREFVQYQTLRNLMAEAVREDESARIASFDLPETIAYLWSTGGLSDNVLASVESSLDEALDTSDE